MPNKPIRPLLERAIEKNDEITEFTAFPVLFNTAEGRIQPSRRSSRKDESYASYPVEGVESEKVVAVWHTPKTVELALNNGMRVSIEIAPPTLAMRILPASSSEDDSVAPLTLIRHDEDIKPTAQMVESRLHALRQLYAIGVIAQDPAQYLSHIRAADIDRDFDYENLLESDERLILRSAGQGTFWAVVQKTGLFAQKAPKTTLVFLTTVLKGGVARTQRYVDAHVQQAQAVADKTTAEARAAELQNEVAQENAKQAATQARIYTARMQIAAEKDQVDLNRAKFAEEKEKMDALLEYFARIENIKDPEIREFMRAEAMGSSRTLIGPNTAKWLGSVKPKTFPVNPSES